MNITKVSKYIALILRHKPDAAGITLDEHGWANVKDLIKGVNKTYKLDMETLEEIVETDDKQRYAFNDDKTMIRANQGHSVDVDVELEEVVPPEYLWHGTATKYASSISRYGLVPKSRLYVHLSMDVDTALKIGERHGNPMVYCVSALEMYNNGYKFYKSKNGVWLTKFVPIEYL